MMAFSFSMLSFMEPLDSRDLHTIGVSKAYRQKTAPNKIRQPIKFNNVDHLFYGLQGIWRWQD